MTHQCQKACNTLWPLC